MELCRLLFLNRHRSSWKEVMEVLLLSSLFCALIAIGETRGRPGYLNYVYQNPFHRDIYPFFPDLTGFRSGSPIVLQLFNKKHPNGITITPDDQTENFIKLFIPNTKIKFVTHGWTSDETSVGVSGIRKAYLHNDESISVVEVGWGYISKNEYTITSMMLHQVAEYAGKTLIKILDEGIADLDNIHVIGHSLGAHAAGLIGGYVRSTGRGLVARVTGLDPAKPLFELIRGEDSRLDQGDAKFVDVIHTCIGLSYVENLGHADFYPNGGYCTQPGCFNFINPLSTASCAHAMSYHWYIASIFDRDAFPAVNCDSFMTYEIGNCENNKVAYMGAYTLPSTRGSYYLSTSNATSNNENVETTTLLD